MTTICKNSKNLTVMRPEYDERACYSYFVRTTLTWTSLAGPNHFETQTIHANEGILDKCSTICHLHRLLNAYLSCVIHAQLELSGNHNIMSGTHHSAVFGRNSSFLCWPHGTPAIRGTSIEIIIDWGGLEWFDDIEGARKRM